LVDLKPDPIGPGGEELRSTRSIAIIGDVSGAIQAAESNSKLEVRNRASEIKIQVELAAFSMNHRFPIIDQETFEPETRALAFRPRDSE
jgi:hypothetical protein